MTPAWHPPDPGDIVDGLLQVLSRRRVVVLAGAGCSTESGIPDYRGPDGRLKVRTPIQFGEFVRSSEARARYWARSTVGWQRVSTARPNPAHGALARLEEGGEARGVITQNVDGLHHAAGSRRVVELHGSLARVRCMACEASTPRQDFQACLLERNADWIGTVAVEAGGDRSAPDGDAELDRRDYADFVVPPCAECGGVLKPDVVFFGESVPRHVVDEAWSLFDESDALLVVGSSLQVFSGRRFAYRARDRQMPIVILTLGPTRADELATLKVEAPLGQALPRLAEHLLSENRALQ